MWGCSNARSASRRLSRMQQLEAHEVPLHKTFSSDYDFRIPDYQRPYAWQVEQAAQLLKIINGGGYEHC
jgi:hypothetical protein